MIRLGTPLLIALFAASISQAQQSVLTDTCTPKLYRWQEDCRALAENHDSLSALQRLRYWPLTPTGSTWLTLGGEYRLKIESLSQSSFGIRGTESYTTTGERFLVDVDFRTQAGPRIFVQFSAATDSGRKPAERSFDKSDPDLAQAFVDLPVSVDAANFLLRIGRQELDLGGNRLVAVRDAANLRRAFDLVLASATVGRFSAQAFAGHPVLNKVGAFDDSKASGETFWGSCFAAVLGNASNAPVGEVFLLGRSRNRAVYQDAVGSEVRRTFGVRLSQRQTHFDFATQASVQRGNVAGKTIRAYGFAADIGYTTPAIWHSRLGVSFGVASGDHKSGDGQIGTFDVLYPNLGYFTDAPLTYPGNDWDIQPNITLQPWRKLTLQSGVDLLHRISSHDAIYETPGVPLVLGIGQSGSFIAALSFVKATWRPSDHWDLVASYVHASVGALVKDAGGRDADYGDLQFSFKL